MVDRITYDGVSRRSVTDRFTVRRGSVRKLQFTLEQVPAPQLVKRLRSAGFGKVELYGAGGAAFDPEGPRLVAVAWRGDDRPEPTVSLEEVDTDNVRDVCDLRLAPGQEPYVAPSAYTVADAHVYGGSWLRAIHAGDTVVGVLALLDDPTPYLVRFMIGAQYQGRGYGRAAIGLLAAHVRDARGASMLQTSCIPGPDSPVGFYTKVGFERTGEVSNGEDVMALRLR
jgi:diamine N-acetyltransferase